MYQLNIIIVLYDIRQYNQAECVKSLIDVKSLGISYDIFIYLFFTYIAFIFGSPLSEAAPLVPLPLADMIMFARGRFYIEAGGLPALLGEL